MATKFITSTITGQKWYTGIGYAFEFEEDGIEYIGFSRDCDFHNAVVVESIPGKELKQLRELEESSLACRLIESKSER
jgi:transposase